MNLLQETLEDIRRVGKTPARVVFIGSADGKLGCTIEGFATLANFEYDEGFGAAHIPSDLVVLFDDNTWLSRHEYDGSEGWVYNDAPKRPESYEPIVNLGARGVGLWVDVAETNGLTEDA